MGVVAFYTVRLAAERDRVRFEARKSTQVSEFLTDLLTRTDPFGKGSSRTTVQDLLDAGAARAKKDLASQPDLQRKLLTLLGRIYDRRGATGLALPLLAEAVALGRRTRGPSAELAQSLNDLGVAQGNRSQLAAAEGSLEEALALRQRLYGELHPEVAATHSELGRILLDGGRLRPAERHLRAALETRRRLLGRGDRETAISLSDYGMLLRQKGDGAGAEAAQREALAVLRRAHGRAHPELAMALTRLGLTVNERGDPGAAEGLFRQALEIARATLGDRHPDFAQMLANLGSALRREGRLAEAAVAYERSLAITRSALGLQELVIARQEVGLARVYLDQGRPARAEPLLRHALAVQQRASLSARDWRTAAVESLLGETLTGLGRFPEAEDLLLRAREVLRTPRDATTLPAGEAAANRGRLAALYQAWGPPAKGAAAHP